MSISTLRFADRFLPDTDCIFGRKSAPRSHWLYRVGDAQTREVFQSDTIIIEIRGEGHQTVLPGSVHQTGEKIEFAPNKDKAPSLSSWGTLRHAATKIAIARELRANWKSSKRHDLSLVAAAFLCRRGWKAQEVEELIEPVACDAGDPELTDRLTAVATTFERFARGQGISGDRALDGLIEPTSADHLRKWCGGRTVPDVWAQTGVALDISNDANAADAFAEQHANDLIYCDKRWYGCKGEIFEPISDAVVQGRAKQFLQNQVATILSALPPSPFDKAPQVKSYLSKTRIDAVVELARAKLLVRAADMDCRGDLLGCSDGKVLALTSPAQARPNVIITKKLGASPLPDATCPNWIAFLAKIFDDDDKLISFVQRAVGYSLTGYVSEQCLFILVGTGANGKSTFLRTLSKLFGDYAGAIPIQTLMHQKHGNPQTNDLAALVGNRFVTACEGERDQKLAEAKIKLMTGGDAISCRRLYGEFFDYEPQFKMWFATNNLPRITGTDEGIWRRIRLIEFRVTIPPDQQDRHLCDRLLQELPGILNWALQGLAEWQIQGLNPPECVLRSTKQYREQNDSVGLWFEAACTPEPKTRTAMQDLYQSYEQWCQNSGLEPASKESLGKELTRRGFPKERRRRGMVYVGIALKPDEDLDAKADSGQSGA
jgi:putative DNA primase/helicase